MRYDLNAESAVLSAVLNDPDCISKVVSVIPKDDVFYHTEFKEIYEAMRELFIEDTAIDTITILDRMKKNKTATKKTIYTLNDVSDVVLSSSNLESHLGVVLEAYTSRKYAEMAHRIKEASKTKGGEALLKIAMEYEYLQKLGTTKGAQDMSSIIGDDINELKELEDKDEQRDLGIKYGMGLDNIMRLLKGEIYFIGGRPSMGKTSFALKLAYNVALKGKTVYCCTLETTKKQYNHKLISITQRISDIAFKKLPLAQQANRQKELMEILEIYSARMIVDDSSYTMEKIMAEARHLKNNGGLDLLVIDQLTLLRMTHYAGNRYGEVTEMTRELKLFAKKMDIPLVILVQLNRKVEEREDKRPKLSDLRESGSIEQDACGVIFLYRPEVYGIVVDNGIPTEGLAEIIVAKNRYGGIGKKKAFFHKESTNFMPWSKREEFMKQEEFDEEFNFKKEA